MSVTLRVLEGNLTVPCLVNFPQGIPNNDSDDLQITISQKKGNKKIKNIVSTNVNGIVYQGSDFDENSNTKNSYKYLIGIMNNDNEMNLTEVNHIYVMKPILKATSNIPRLSVMSNYDRKQSLTEEFGSKKKKRALKAAQSNIILTENIVGSAAVQSAMNESFESIDNNMVLLNAADDALEKNRLKLLPEHSIEADNPSDAYPIQPLIPDTIITSINDFIQDSIEANGNCNEEMIKILSTISHVGSNSFINSLIDHMKTTVLTIESNKKAYKKMKGNLEKILYFYFMLQLYMIMNSAKSGNIFKSDLLETLNAPTAVISHLTENFMIAKRSTGKISFSVTKTNM